MTPMATALLLTAALPLQGQAAKSYVLAGNNVAVYNLAGVVSVRGIPSGETTVEVTLIGSDAGKVTVATGPLRGAEALRVVYPEDRIVYRAMGSGSNTSFTIRDDGTWGNEEESQQHRDGGRKITIRGSGDGVEAAANLSIALPPGRRAAIHLGVGRMDVSNVNGQILLDAASANVSASGMRGRLHIDTGSGDVRADGVDGDASLDTGSGDVAVTGTKNGVLHIDTGSGTVTGSQLEATEIRIDTGSGDIRLDGVTSPRLVLETGSGSVKAQMNARVDDLSVETGSGDVTLRLAQGSGATVDLETGSGEFTLEIPVQLIRKDEDSLRGQIGDGHGRIHIETGSGDIALVN